METSYTGFPTKDETSIRGVFSNLTRGGGLNFYFPGGTQLPFGPENPMKSIDFNGPGWA